MILVLFTECGGCKVASDYAPVEWERVTIGSWRGLQRQRDIKKALFRLKHDKKFPCILSDDLNTLILKDEVDQRIKDGTLNRF